MFTNVKISHKVVKPFERVAVRPHVVGSDVKEDIRLIRDINGNCTYTKVAESSISDYVQSFKDGASLEHVLERIKYMPASEKIAYLSQLSNGFSCDNVSLPKNGTEAFLMLKRLNDICPDVGSQLRSGASVEDIMKGLKAKYNPDPVKKTDDVKEEVTNG